MNPCGSFDLPPALLQRFLVLADAADVDRAASQLTISQAALRKSIGKLERQLGTSLFASDARVLQLTAEGEALKPAAQRVVSAAARLKSTVHSLHGVLRVAHSSSVDTLATVLDRYADSYPDVRIEEQVLPCDVQLTALREREIDVAVCRVASAAPPDDCNAELIRLDPILAAVAPIAGVASLSVDPARTPVYVGETNGEWSALDELVASYEQAAGCDLRHVDVLISAGQDVATLERTRAPVFLAMSSSRALPKDRRLVGLVPLQPYFPWSVVWPRDCSDTVTTFVQIARAVASDNGWLAVDRLPGTPWIPGARLT